MTVTCIHLYEVLPSYKGVQWGEIEKTGRAKASEIQQQVLSSLTDAIDTDKGQ